MTPDTPGDIRDVITFKLARVTTLNDRMGQRLFSQELGLSLREFRTLATVSYLGMATTTALARESFLDHAQVSRMVAALVARGLLERLGGGTRGGVLRLTEAGARMVEDGIAFAARQNRRLVEDMPAGDIETLARLVDDLLGHAQAMYAKVNGEITSLVDGAAADGGPDP